MLIYDYYRMFSRNIYKRQTENQWYLDHTEKLRRMLNLRRDQFKQRKDYKFFNCPNCNTTVRVPKGKGTLTVVGEKEEVKEGDYVFIPSWAKHSLVNKGDDELHMMFVYIPNTIVDHWAQEQNGEI